MVDSCVKFPCYSSFLWFYFTVQTQARFAHTDIAYPDFSAYRRKEVQDPKSKNEDSIDERQSFTYLIAAGLY